MLHLHDLIKKHTSVFLSKPLCNTRPKEKAIHDVGNSQDSHHDLVVYLKDRHEAQYRHHAINENPQDWVWIIKLQGSKRQKHESEKTVKKFHSQNSKIQSDKPILELYQVGI